MTNSFLHKLLIDSADRWPDRTAVVHRPFGELTYHQLDSLSDQVCNSLVAGGVNPGDRVGIYIEKSLG